MSRLLAVAHGAAAGAAARAVGGSSANRTAFQQLLNDPMSGFTDAEQAILRGPAPAYSQENIEEDAEYESYKCPLLQDFPAPDNVVLWRNQYYDGPMLDQYKAASIDRRLDPRTNQLVEDDHEWLHSQRHLNDSEKEDYELLQETYNLRADRRNAYRLYSNLRERYNQLSRSSSQRQNVLDRQRNHRRSSGAPPAVADAGDNPLNENREDVAILPGHFHDPNDMNSQLAFQRLLRYCKDKGYENTLVRGVRSTWTNRQGGQLFEVGGPWFGQVSSLLVCIIIFFFANTLP